MSSFTNPLEVIYDPEKNMWITGRQFTYFVGEENSDERIVVPKGFLTDFASVPWPASMLIPKIGRYNQAAVLHDWLYNKRGKLSRREYTRAECDKIFLEAMTVLGVNWFKRKLMYRAVRAGGWVPWSRKVQTKKEEK